MSDKEANRLATAAQIRAGAERDAWEPEERIVLPKSGFAVIVRRPRPLAYAMSGIPLPQGLAAKLAAADGAEQAALTREEQVAMVLSYAAVTAAAFVKPRASTSPGPDEFDPRWLPPEDQAFLSRYLGGEIDAAGASLETFRGQRARPAAAGADGGGVEGTPL